MRVCMASHGTRHTLRVDEIIRQVTIGTTERGLLLLRIRDEIRMTLAAYQTLYESSIAFGMRKALQAEAGKADMEAKARCMHCHATHTPLTACRSPNWSRTSATSRRRSICSRPRTVRALCGGLQLARRACRRD